MYLALSLLNLKGEALRSVSRVSWDRRALPVSIVSPPLALRSPAFCPGAASSETGSDPLGADAAAGLSPELCPHSVVSVLSGSTPGSRGRCQPRASQPRTCAPGRASRELPPAPAPPGWPKAPLKRTRSPRPAFGLQCPDSS